MPKIRSAHHCSHHHSANCLILVLGCRHVIALNFVWVKKHRNLFLLVVSYQASFNWWHSCWSRILLMILLFLHHSSVIGNSCIPPHLIVAVLALIAAIIRWIWWFRVELLEWIVWTLLRLWNLYIYVLSYLNRRRLNKTILQLLLRDEWIIDDCRLEVVVELLLRHIWRIHVVLLVISIETTLWTPLSIRYGVASVYKTLPHVCIWAIHRCKWNYVVVRSSTSTQIDDLTYFPAIR
jgi:hypothetical protein